MSTPGPDVNVLTESGCTGKPDNRETRITSNGVGPVTRDRSNSPKSVVYVAPCCCAGFGGAPTQKISGRGLAQPVDGNELDAVAPALTDRLAEPRLKQFDVVGDDHLHFAFQIGREIEQGPV